MPVKPPVATLALILGAWCLTVTGCTKSDSTETPPAATTKTTSTTASATSASASVTPVVLEFEVTPMSCQGCVSAITEVVSKLDGVSAVDVTLEDKHARITCDSPDRAAEIVAALKDDLRDAVLIAQP
jgi:copper chaperone CopZ